MSETTEITKAVSILRRGGLVAMPTETVYGLAADAKNEAAVNHIFEAKERPFNHPLIVHIENAEQLSDWAIDIPNEAWQLAKAFWPGPLTLILKKQKHVLGLVTGNQETIGLRVPCHPIAQALLKAFGSGLAAPSANKFTHISPTTASAVREELGEKVDMILDGGDCKVGLESTILDLTNEMPVILRPGMINPEHLSVVLGRKIISSQLTQASHSNQQSKNSAVLAPGMHHLHYAPITKTSLIATKDISNYLQFLSTKDFSLVLITHSEMQLPAANNFLHVQLSQDANVYAHDLYHTLRKVDNQHFQQILIETVPETTEWDAIRDRLSKASCRD